MIYYALNKNDATLLITINSFGIVIETIYLSLFIAYAPKKIRVRFFCCRTVLSCFFRYLEISKLYINLGFAAGFDYKTRGALKYCVICDDSCGYILLHPTTETSTYSGRDQSSAFLHCICRTSQYHRKYMHIADSHKFTCLCSQILVHTLCVYLQF